MTARKMTAADYAELGMSPPPGFDGFPERRFRWTHQDTHVMDAAGYFKATDAMRQRREEQSVPGRCDECGDMCGQCSCADD